jgi:hypothetical protein
MKKSIYLIANYTIKPKNPKRTHEKEYMSNANNFQYDEQVVIAKKIKPKDEQYAKIILDLVDKKVKRNGFRSENNFEDLMNYFFKGYEQYIATVLVHLDPDYLKELEERNFPERKIKAEDAEETTN